MDSVKRLLGIGTPGGLDDLVIRAVKTAISTFFGLVGLSALDIIHNFDGSRAAAIAAAAAGVNVLLNALLLWANGS